MVICNIQFLCLKSIVDTTFQCNGKPEKIKASDKGKTFPCNSTFLYFKKWKIKFGKYTKTTLSKSLAERKFSC